MEKRLLTSLSLIHRNKYFASISESTWIWVELARCELLQHYKQNSRIRNILLMKTLDLHLVYCSLVTIKRRIKVIVTVRVTISFLKFHTKL